MQFLKNSIYPLLFCIIGLVVFMAPVYAADEATANKTEAIKTEVPNPARYLVVTYFHTTFRCPTCHKIEEYSKSAVEFNFENELKSGKVVWRVINVEEPEHEHYVKDYQLYSKHLIVSEMKDGKEVRWKDLKEVWSCVRDEAVFNEYVKTEIADWLKE